MKKLSLKAIVIGGIVDVGSSMFLGIIFGVYMFIRLGLAHVAKESAESILRGNSLFQIGALVIGLACSIFGGFVAGRIAKHDHLVNGVLSSYLCILMGIVSLALGMDSHSLWQQILMMISSPLCSLLGGYFSRQEPRTVVSVPS